MNENHNIIWNKISDLNTGKKIRKKLKKIKIQQINKEKIINHQESNSIKIEANNNSKALFINKKRGRRIKNSNTNFLIPLKKKGKNNIIHSNSVSSTIYNDETVYENIQNIFNTQS